MNISLLTNLPNFENYQSTMLGKSTVCLFSCGDSSSSFDDPFILNRLSGWYDWFCTYFTQGSADIIVNGESYTVQANDFLIVPPNTPYIISAAESERYWAHFRIQDTDLLFKQLNFKRGQYIYPVGAHHSIAAAYKSIIAETLSFRPFSNELSSCYLMQILSLVSRYTAEQQIASDNEQNKPVQTIINYINKNYKRAITIEELAGIVGYAPRYIFKIFRNVTSVTPVKYINMVRIQKAKELILSTPYKMNEIAEKVGFSDVYYFSRVFKMLEGRSPMQFKKEVMEDKNE